MALWVKLGGLAVGEFSVEILKTSSLIFCSLYLLHQPIQDLFRLLTNIKVKSTVLVYLRTLKVLNFRRLGPKLKFSWPALLAVSVKLTRIPLGVISHHSVGNAPTNPKFIEFSQFDPYFHLVKLFFIFFCNFQKKRPSKFFFNLKKNDFLTKMA